MTKKNKIKELPEKFELCHRLVEEYVLLNNSTDFF